MFEDNHFESRNIKYEKYFWVWKFRVWKFRVLKFRFYLGVKVPGVKGPSTVVGDLINKFNLILIL